MTGPSGGSGTMAAVSSKQSDPEKAAVAENTEEPDVPDQAQETGEPDQGRPRRLLALVFGIAVVALGLDLASKIAVVANLEGEPPVELLGGLVYFDVLRNPGAAFSLATGMTWLLALLAIVVVGVIIWLSRKLRSTGWAIGLGLVLGGACGNLVDRLFRAPGPLQGHVVDFISVLAPGGRYYPVFNLADSAIVCGGILVVLLSLLGRDYDGTVHRRKRAKS